MRIAIFSDVHGNYLNLVSFFESVATLNIDKYICLGDLCNYYPDNIKVIDLIKEKNITCLLGNHDELYISNKKLSEKQRLAYNFDDSVLQAKDQLLYLKSLPLSYEMKVEGKTLFFCHASPIDLMNTYIYPDTDLNLYNDVPYDYIFMGHTHRQFLTTHQSKVFCNVGSIGLPRDNGALIGFAILDTNNVSIQLYRKQIDVEQVKAHYQGNTPSNVIALLTRHEILNYQYTKI